MNLDIERTLRRRRVNGNLAFVAAAFALLAFILSVSGVLRDELTLVAVSGIVQLVAIMLAIVLIIFEVLNLKDLRGLFIKIAPEVTVIVGAALVVTLVFQIIGVFLLLIGGIMSVIYISPRDMSIFKGEAIQNGHPLVYPTSEFDVDGHPVSGDLPEELQERGGKMPTAQEGAEYQRDPRSFEDKNSEI